MTFSFSETARTSESMQKAPLKVKNETAREEIQREERA
jgi:hypothetical protein